MGLNYIIDPLLYYKRPNRDISTLYSEDSRYQIPGLIKNFQDHNAAIIGTSTAGNFLVSEVSESLNEKTVKLTVNGATFSEQSYILSKYLNAHPDAKIIIWGIDTFYIDVEPLQFTIREYTYPYFLYDDSTINLQYLLSYPVTVHSFQTITGHLLGIRFQQKTKNVDMIHTWPPDTPLGCKPVIANYNALSGKQFKVVDPSLTPLQYFNKSNAAANLDKIVTLAKNNNKVNFYLFLPPYSIVRYLFEEETHGLERILEARNFFAERTKGISNIKIIDLQASEDIISNLDYYMDMIHHNRTINNRIIKNIADGNFNEYESIIKNTDTLRALVDKYDLEKLKKCED